MIFGKKRIQRNIDFFENRYNSYAPIVENSDYEEPQHGVTPTLIRHEVVSYCEQMLEVSKEIDDTRAEYRMVTSFLNDIQIIEQLSTKDREAIVVTAEKITQLNKAREDFLNADRELTENQFAQMKKEEDSIPGVVKRLEENESHLATIKRDLHYLEGEKVEWEIVRKECLREQKLLRTMAVVLFVVFATAMAALFYAGIAMEISVRLPILITILVSALMGTYILFKYQDCTKEIEQSMANRNRAITLENHIKIKYVNMKNAVDYACDKYHITNSKQLTYMYERYQDSVREQMHFQQMNEELTYYEGQLARQLKAHWLKDPKGWTNYVNALTSKKELALLKNDLMSRRKKLKYRLEYNIDAIREMKKNVERNLDELGEIRPQIEEILHRIEAISRNVV